MFVGFWDRFKHSHIGWLFKIVGIHLTCFGFNQVDNSLYTRANQSRLHRTQYKVGDMFVNFVGRLVV